MAPLAGVRHAGRKWIQAPRPELYDLRHDPGELDNRYPADSAGARPLEATLDEVVADSGRHAVTPVTRAIDRETEDMLRALGYLAPPEERAEMGGRDPKDGMALYTKLQEARQCAQAGEWERAQTILTEVLAIAPENVTARNVLALCAVRRGDYEEAERQYAASLERQPNQHRVHGALGSLAIRRDDLEAAEQHFRRALEMAPGYVEAMSNLGWIAAARGDGAGAQAWYERAIALDPAYPHVYRRLADLYYDRKDWPHAREYYARVLVALPQYFDVLIQAGNAARFAGDDVAAADAYAEAARARPDAWIAPYNLACLRAAGGDPDGAFELLGQAIDRGLEGPALLDGNRDFETLRRMAAWPALRARLGTAARASGDAGPARRSSRGT